MRQTLSFRISLSVLSDGKCHASELSSLGVDAIIPFTLGTLHPFDAKNYEEALISRLHLKTATRADFMLSIVTEAGALPRASQILMEELPCYSMSRELVYECKR